MSEQTTVSNDNAVLKAPIFFRASFIAALLALSTPVLAFLAAGIWDRFWPPPQPEWYESAPMMSDIGRGFTVVLYAVGWFLVMEALGIILAIIGVVRKERGSVRAWAIGTMIAAVTIPVLLYILVKI